MRSRLPKSHLNSSHFVSFGVWRVCRETNVRIFAATGDDASRLTNILARCDVRCEVPKKIGGSDFPLAFRRCLLYTYVIRYAFHFQRGFDDT